MSFGRRYLPALLCALFLPLCLLVVQPFVASGMNDDWAYMQTAQTLFHTGHVVYNGWSAPMLGWQLFWSDLLLHLFGDSITTIRVGTMLVGAATACLLQRMLVRAGLGQALAALDVLTLVGSPLFVPLAFSYMTDVYGLFSIVLCVWCCMRALQAATNRAALLWMCGAIASNAITGTTRQVAWLGVLVICPCALWLLRKRRGVVVPAAIAMLAAWAFVAWCLHWFGSQPFTQAESLGAPVTPITIPIFIRTAGRVPLMLLMLMLPALTLLPGALPRRRLMLIVAGGGAFALFVVTGLCVLHQYLFQFLLFPYFGNYLSVYGAASGTFLHGRRPVELGTAARLVWTTLGLMLGAALLLTLRDRRTALRAPDTQAITWGQLHMLLLPYLGVYFSLLVPRTFSGGMFDRYLLPPMMIALLYLLRFYREHVPAQRMAPAWLMVGVLAAYAVATTHDLFALHRARLQAVQEMLDRGLAPDIIDGGFEYNGLEEVRRTGYVHAPRMRETSGLTIPAVKDSPASCLPEWIAIMPDLHAQYGIGFQPELCGGPVGLPPVSYTAWLGPHHVNLYIIGLTARGTTPRTDSPAMPGR